LLHHVAPVVGVFCAGMRLASTNAPAAALQASSFPARPWSTRSRPVEKVRRFARNVAMNSKRQFT